MTRQMVHRVAPMSGTLAQAFTIAPPRRIAVVRALQLGDLLLAVPALRALRSRFPGAEVTLIGLPWAAEYARRFTRYIDRFVEFPGWPGIDETPYSAARTERFIDEQRDYRYDLVIQMHGSGEQSNPFALALGGEATVGYVAAEACPEGCSGALDLAARYPDDQHEIVRNLGLAWLVGADSRDTRLEFPLTPTDHAAARTLLAPLEGRGNHGGPLIGLHAGARASARRWPAESFGALADLLAREMGARIVLTGGPAEREIASAVERHMRSPALNLAGETTLGALAALMTSLDLLISNDTGAAHLAYAVDAPALTIFGPGEVQRWGPLDVRRGQIVRAPVECSPCGYRDCPIDHRCLRRVTPELVYAAASRMLGKGGAA